MLLAGAAILGVGLSLSLIAPLWLAGVAAIASGALAIVIPRRTVLIGLALLALTLGLVRGQAHLAAEPPGVIAAGDGAGIIATGTVLRAPGRLTRSPMLVRLDSVRPAGEG